MNGIVVLDVGSVSCLEGHIFKEVGLWTMGSCIGACRVIHLLRVLPFVIGPCHHMSQLAQQVSSLLHRQGASVGNHSKQLITEGGRFRIFVT